MVTLKGDCVYTIVYHNASWQGGEGTLYFIRYCSPHFPISTSTYSILSLRHREFLKRHTLRGRTTVNGWICHLLLGSTSNLMSSSSSPGTQINNCLIASESTSSTSILQNLQIHPKAPSALPTFSSLPAILYPEWSKTPNGDSGHRAESCGCEAPLP
jgi:hypothetical protein